LSTAASSSRPCTPSRPSSSALMTLGHRFSDETDSAGSSSSSSCEQGSSSSSESEGCSQDGLDGRIPHFQMQEQSEPSQGSSDQEYDSDLEDLESRCLDEQSLSKKLEDLEERKRTIDQKYNDALSELSTTPPPPSPPTHTHPHTHSPPLSHAMLSYAGSLIHAFLKSSISICIRNLRRARSFLPVLTRTHALAHISAIASGRGQNRKRQAEVPVASIFKSLISCCV
jgi:hypothetical protein